MMPDDDRIDVLRVRGVYICLESIQFHCKFEKRV